jgi:hypothetical protein
MPPAGAYLVNLLIVHVLFLDVFCLRLPNRTLGDRLAGDLDAVTA